MHKGRRFHTNRVVVESRLIGGDFGRTVGSNHANRSFFLLHTSICPDTRRCYEPYTCLHVHGPIYSLQGTGIQSYSHQSQIHNHCQSPLSSRSAICIQNGKSSGCKILIQFDWAQVTRSLLPGRCLVRQQKLKSLSRYYGLVCRLAIEIPYAS
jgi:hypothetical protein